MHQKRPGSLSGAIGCNTLFVVSLACIWQAD